MTDVGYLLICLIAICIKISVNYLLVSLGYFNVGILVFFLLISRSSLYITALSGENLFLNQRLLDRHVSLSVEIVWDGVAPGGPVQIVSLGWGGHPPKRALAANMGHSYIFSRELSSAEWKLVTWEATLLPLGSVHTQ